MISQPGAVSTMCHVSPLLSHLYPSLHPHTPHFVLQGGGKGIACCIHAPDPALSTAATVEQWGW